MDLVSVLILVGVGPHTICSNCDGQWKTVKSQYPSAVLLMLSLYLGLCMNKYYTNTFLLLRHSAKKSLTELMFLFYCHLIH